MTDALRRVLAGIRQSIDDDLAATVYELLLEATLIIRDENESAKLERG